MFSITDTNLNEHEHNIPFIYTALVFQLLSPHLLQQ